MIAFARLLAEGADAPREPAAVELSGRLQSYARYVAVVAEQLEALRLRDTERLNRLSTERKRLEAEIERPTAPATREEQAALDALAAEMPTLLRSGLLVLEERTEEDESVRELWSSIEAGALRAARRVERGRQRHGSYPQGTGAVAKIDLRF